jgi:hypothetical protein
VGVGVGVGVADGVGVGVADGVGVGVDPAALHPMTTTMTRMLPRIDRTDFLRLIFPLVWLARIRPPEPTYRSE